MANLEILGQEYERVCNSSRVLPVVTDVRLSLLLLFQAEHKNLDHFIPRVISIVGVTTLPFHHYGIIINTATSAHSICGL